MRTVLAVLAVTVLYGCPGKQEPPPPAPEVARDTVTPPVTPAPAATPDADEPAPPPPDATATTATPPTPDAPPTPNPAPPLTDAQKAELIKSAAEFKRLLNEGRKLVKDGAYQEGVAKYQRALALNPTNASVLGELGYAALKEGDLDRAEAFTQRAIAYSRDDKQLGALLYNLGQVAEKRGLAADALAAFGRSLAARPNETVAARVAALEAGGTTATVTAAKVYPSLELLLGERVLACLRYVGVWDEQDSGIPRDLSPAAAADGAGPCSVETTQRVKAPAGNTPVSEVAIVTTGTGLYTTADLAMHLESGWIIASTLFENENSGCCGAYRDFAVSPVAFRELVPEQGQEVAFHTRWEDQDSDMGDDNIYHLSHATEVVCGLDAAGQPWCRGARTFELSYDGNLTDFLDAKAGTPHCWTVAFDGAGGYTRTAVGCQDGEPAADKPLAGEAPTRGRVVELTTELP